jgi:chromosome segregation ATPase
MVLRSQVADLTRESQQLRYEIASRERRIEQLQKDLAEAQSTELARMEQRRQQLEQELQAERDAVKRANDRLKEIEQGRPPAKKPEGR